MPVAGVQKASRQQSSFVPFFQTSPNGLRQLSTVWGYDWAEATPEAVTAAKASARANLEGLFMFLLVELEAG
ncbi:hypothetical protein AD428_18935 [Achromobacter sp. DMS1]|nr:hypothetical protein AD428_18935 [Achromobacter sp. DMS1]